MIKITQKDVKVAISESTTIQIKRPKTDHYPVNTVTTEKDDDDDDMFGDDIALEELEDITALMVEAPPLPLVKQEQQDLGVDTSEIFGDDIPLDELGDVLDQVENNVPKPVAERRKFTRYLVANVTREEYTIEDVTFSEKVVLLIQEDIKRVFTARLRQDWQQTIITVGDVVHIPYRSTQTPDIQEIIIDNMQNFIVVHPDRLISCTAVADSYVCLRKSILQMKVRGVSEYTEALVHGDIIHKVLQSALQMGDFSVKNIKSEIERIVMSSLEDLYAMEQDETTAIQILQEYAESIHQFGVTFINQYPKPGAKANTDLGLDPAKEMGYTAISICKVLDIEEHLWSPTYGLKGMVDASVQLKMAPSNKVLTIPFELKTGKASKFLTNRAQTLLYTLLMSDRYDIDVGAGILYYSKTNSLYLVPASRNDLRSLIMARNSLAIAASDRETIPPMIKNFHTCQYCYLNDACTIFHKAIEKGTGATSGLYKLFDEKTSHMTETTCAFFKHWWELLDQEEVDIDYIRKDIWSQQADTREMLGRCLSNMKLNLATCQIDPELKQWQYSFIRHDSKADQLLLSSITLGDPIVVSSMEGHCNLAMGFVTRVGAHEITLSLTEPLRNPPHKSKGFKAANNQDFDGFIRYKGDVNQYYSHVDTQYRIDKDDMTIGMAMLRNNLVQLTTKDEDGRSERLQELIIEKAKPVFRAEQPVLPRTPNMNPDQRKALMRVLQAEDYNLILGMPGTGKTTTTAEIIKYLVSIGKSVLVAAYTHTALDNVLSKVRENGVDILRLGNVEKVMPSMRDCVPSSNSTVQSVAAMQDLYDSKKVVGITCLGIGHVLLQKRQFDYCIIDEASQITLPTCVGPLRYAKTFVLVGDLYQLPPIVRNKDALDGGLDNSLFSILAAAQPQSISYLEHQYRMNREIMDVSNILIYDGKLKCGNYQTASRQLEIPNLQDGLENIHHRENQLCKGLDDCWLKSIMDPSRKVIFVDTDTLAAKESRPFGQFLQNDVEAKLIYQTAEAMLQCGVSEEQLAVISVYRSQLRVISMNLRARQGIEIATIDKYQGRDKDCVIISLVRNNDTGNSGDLLRDWRRLNVAITRAQSKLILFGSASTLKASSLYCSLLESFEKRGWILNMPPGSEMSHESLCIAKRNVPPQSSNESSSKHKTFLPINSILKKNEVLRDIYNNAV